MAEEKILDRVRKLLELAKSDNVNEAASAAAQAQALMSRHSIDSAMLTTVTAEEEIETDILSAAEGKQLEVWRSTLARGVCNANNAKHWRSGATLHIIGRPSDASKARYIFMHVEREILRLCKQAAAERGSPGKTWCNNFKIGAAETVAKRLEEAHRETIAAMRREANDGDTMGTGAALVRVNNALVKLEKVKVDVVMYGKLKLKLRKGPKRKWTHDEGAREQGRRAGASIGLAPATGGALGAGNRARLNG